MEGDPETEIVHRILDTERGEPGIQIAEMIAEIENKEIDQLSTLYTCIDGVLQNLFADPPDEEAQMQIKFSYEGYRVNVNQDGSAEFMKT